MVTILAIETATEACSAALWKDGAITSVFELAPQRHAHLILPMVQQLLSDAGLTTSHLSAIAYGSGPGSFTGVRIAAAVTQGIALAYDLPVIPISTLQALAQEAHLKHGVTKVLAGMDARMKEVYWAAYVLNKSENEHENKMQLYNPEKVISPALLELPQTTDWFGAGSAWKVYESELREKFEKVLSIEKVPKSYDGECFPTAHAVAVLAADSYQKRNMFPPEKALPVYLRNKIIAE